MTVMKEVKLGPNVYPIVFNSMALYMLERETGLTIERLGLFLATGRLGFQTAHTMMWAALEAARKRTQYRPAPFTVEEVGELLDLEGGSAIVFLGADDGMVEEEQPDGTTKRVQRYEARPSHPAGEAMLEAWKTAFPKPREVINPNPPNAPSEN